LTSKFFLKLRELGIFLFSQSNATHKSSHNRTDTNCILSRVNFINLITYLILCRRIKCVTNPAGFTISEPAIFPFFFSKFPDWFWDTSSLILNEQRPGHKVENAPASSVEVKNVWSHASNPPIQRRGLYWDFSFIVLISFTSWGGGGEGESHNITLASPLRKEFIEFRSSHPKVVISKWKAIFTIYRIALDSFPV